MNILSLFDGISCARVALERAGFPVELYYASEVDKYAIWITQKNFPDTIQLGDVKSLRVELENIDRKWTKDIDLLIGGSPCQDLSIAKKDRKGLSGERSGLFWEYVRILKEVKPKYFILENVASMPKEAKEIITQELFGIEPVMINAALVSAQNRKRLFWVGKLVGGTYEKVEIPQPEDRGILLKDILEKDVDFKYCISSNQAHATISENKSAPMVSAMGMGGGHVPYVSKIPQRIGLIGKGGQGDRVYSIEGKSVNLSANGGGRGAKTGLYAVKDFVRKLTPIECERLQSLPDRYSEKGINEKGEEVDISNTQRYKCLGNAFNVEVVVHILKGLK